MSGLYGLPSDQAWQAAEAIRGLNHATIGGTGYEWPSDVDAVIAALETLAHRRPQALDQARTWLARAQQAGTVGHDQGIDASDAVSAVLLSLQAASDHAHRLADELAAGREDSSHLTGDLGALLDDEVPS